MRAGRKCCVPLVATHPWEDHAMQLDQASLGKGLSRDLMDLLIRLGLIALLVVLCVRVFQPFVGLILWALVLAVALYPLHRRVAKWVGGRQGWAATLVVLAGVLLIGVPGVMLGNAFAGHTEALHSAFKNDAIAISPPDQAVAQWPLVGPQVFEIWHLAATDLPALLEKIKPQLESLSKFLLSMAASTVGGILQFLGSLIIAGIMMAHGESGSRAMQRIVSRVVGADRGPRLHRLSTATIRSVATGVIGVAIIQALLVGLGLVWAEVPGAGLLALVILVIGIAQLPATIITLPVIGYLWWSGDSTPANIFFTAYLLLTGMADSVLKPLLLGRGVEAPMPVILLGALGGMVSGGIIGLFLGAVLLAVGYRIFMDWVAAGEPTEAESGPAESTPSASGGA
jgi:predicted PurR-regulated permease PerM